MNRPALLLVLSLAALLGGCDLFGTEAAEKAAAARDAEGKAIGGACRHAGRAIEDCYLLNKKADKAAIFAGWRDMNDYMRENKLDVVAPQLQPPPERSARGEGSGLRGENAARGEVTRSASTAEGRPGLAAADTRASDARGGVIERRAAIVKPADERGAESPAPTREPRLAELRREPAAVLPPIDKPAPPPKARDAHTRGS